MKNIKGIICFDMDGTIADLYGIANWKQRLEEECPMLYGEAKPMWDMGALRKILKRLQNEGWQIRVITWLSETASDAYKEHTRNVKINWLNQHNFPATYVHIERYGYDKKKCVMRQNVNAILIDDNPHCRGAWDLGKTIDPARQNILEELCKLLD